MFRLAWITDLHFNFLPFERVDEFLGQVADRRPDAVVLTGDVSEAHDLAAMLAHIDDLIQRPLYFVLGNHDFYHGSIRDIRTAVTALCDARPRLCYLTATDEPIELVPGVALVGHDGWADARLGDYERSMVMMNDYRLIAELTRHTKLERWALLKALGDEAAAHIRKVLPPALDRYPPRDPGHACPPVARGLLARRTALRRRVGAALHVQGAGRRDPGNHGPLPQPRAYGPLRSHAQQRPMPSAAEHPHLHRRIAIRLSGDLARV